MLRALIQRGHRTIYAMSSTQIASFSSSSSQAMKEFEKAQRELKKLGPGEEPTADIKLKLYGLYKQVRENMYQGMNVY